MFTNNVFILDIDDLTMLTTARIEKFKEEKKSEFAIYQKIADAAIWPMCRSNGTRNEETLNCFEEDGTKSPIINRQDIKFAYLKYCEEFGNGDGLQFPSEREWSMFVDRWRIVNRCLKLIEQKSTQPKNNNYIVIGLTREGAIGGAAKLGVFGVGADYPIKTIFSTTNIPISKVFHLLKLQYGKCAKISLLSSDSNYLESALKADVFIWPVFRNVHILCFYQCLKQHWLVPEDDEVLTNENNKTSQLRQPSDEDEENCDISKSSTKVEGILYELSESFD